MSPDPGGEQTTTGDRVPDSAGIARENRAVMYARHRAVYVCTHGENTPPITFRYGDHTRRRYSISIRKSSLRRSISSIEPQCSKSEHPIIQFIRRKRQPKPNRWLNKGRSWNNWPKMISLWAKHKTTTSGVYLGWNRHFNNVLHLNPCILWPWNSYSTMAVIYFENPVHLTNLSLISWDYYHWFQSRKAKWSWCILIIQ